MATPSDRASWDGFVDSRPTSTAYHAWDWRQVFTGAFAHEPVYLVARRGGEIAGVLPLVHMGGLLFGRLLVSLPFLNYGGVLAESEETARALVAAAVEEGRKRRCRYVELRHQAQQFPDLPCRQHKVSMHLELVDGMWDRFDRKVRNQIRKAQKSGLTSVVGGGELLDEFYTVFSRNMRDLGTPVYSRRLFEAVLQAFPGQARLHVVRRGGQVVAAGLAYRFRQRIEVPWASSIRDFSAMCPNHLLYWSVIERALEEGCSILDFGRSTPGEGTYRFKEQWGARPVGLSWEYPWLAGGALPDASPANPKFHAAVTLWKKLPLPVANRLGPAIVRGIP